MRSSKLVRIYLGAVIAALVAAAVYTYVMIDRREESLDAFSRYNVAYSASQAAIEFQRLQKALLSFAKGAAPENLAEVKLRYEILYNRASILNQGEFFRFTRANPEHIGIVADFQNTVRYLDPALADATLDLNAEAILLVLSPLEPRIISLAAEANRYGADRVFIDREALLQFHQQLSALSLRSSSADSAWSPR
jgi:hypothetical protein